MLWVCNDLYSSFPCSPHIRYGALRTEPDFESQIEDALGHNNSLYEDESDDDEAAARGGGGVFLFGNKQATPKPTYGGTSSSPSNKDTAGKIGEAWLQGILGIREGFCIMIFKRLINLDAFVHRIGIELKSLYLEVNNIIFSLPISP